MVGMGMLMLVSSWAGWWLYRRSGSKAVVNPVLLAVVFISVVLAVTGIDYRTYFEGAQFVHFLLGPATVAIAGSALLLTGLLLVALRPVPVEGRERVVARDAIPPVLADRTRGRVLAQVGAELLLAQPVRRMQLFLGQFLGLASPLSAAFLVGVGVTVFAQRYRDLIQFTFVPPQPGGLGEQAQEETHGAAQKRHRRKKRQRRLDERFVAEHLVIDRGETGQGAELSADAHHGADQLVMEARCYGLAKRWDPFQLNTVVGFIGPEYLYDGKQVIRAGLEDHFCGKLLGLPMGCDVCYTNHAEADQDDMDNLLTLLGVAGCGRVAVAAGAVVHLRHDDQLFLAVDVDRRRARIPW